MYTKTIIGSRVLTINGTTVGVVQGPINFAFDQETVDILDTSVFPQTILERRPTRTIGVTMTAKTASINSTNVGLINGIMAAQTAVTIALVNTRRAGEGGGAVSISFSGTLTGSTIDSDDGNGNWMLQGFTCKSIGAPTVGSTL